MHAAAILLAVLSLLSIILLIPPLFWHTKYSKNIPAIALILWLIFSNFKNCINVLIWSVDDFDQVWDGKVYCDIVTRLDRAGYSGKLCALSAVSLNLYMILKGNSTFIAKDGPQARRKNWINLAVCLVTPFMIMALQILIDGQRYAIFKHRGCVSLFYPTWLAIPLIYIWPLLWSIFATVVSLLTIVSYYRKRNDLKDLLNCSGSFLNLKRFGRVLVYSVAMLLVMLPATIYMFITNAPSSTARYSWLNIHWEGWLVIYYIDLGFYGLYNSWLDVALSIITFLFFGLGTEALKMYKRALNHIISFGEDIDEPYFEQDLKKRSTGASDSTSGGTTIVGVCPSKMNTVDYSLGQIESEFQNGIDEFSLVENFNFDLDEGKPSLFPASQEKYCNLEDIEGNSLDVEDCEVTYHYLVQKL